jgi:hypothetical protein
VRTARALAVSVTLIADCPAGAACVCAPMGGGAGSSGSPSACVTSGCRTDADCASGFCSPSYAGGCNGPVGFFCHAGNDECGNDTDCVYDGHAPFRAACVYSAANGHWACAAIPLCIS